MTTLPPLTINDPVPSRIVREIADAMGKIDIIGPENVLELDPAFSQATDNADWPQRVAQATSSGKHAVIVESGPVDMVMPESSGGRKYTNIDEFELPVALTVYLPNPIPAGQTPAEAAHKVMQRVYAIAGSLSPLNGETQCGRWLEFAGTNTPGPALAIWTDVVGGGGVFMPDTDSRATAIGLLVRFRVLRGQMEAAQ